MLDKIKFEITTPERIVYQDEIDQVTLPTKMGEITVLPHHLPLVSILVPGELRIKKGEEEIIMAVSGGFIEVQTNKVIVLADTAERAEEIDVAKAEEARKRAKEFLDKKQTEKVDFAGLTAKMEKELVRLKVARKRKAGRVERPLGQDYLSKKGEKSG